MTKAMRIPGWPEAFTPQMPGFATDQNAASAPNPFTDGLDFVKTLWSGVPGAATGMALPTFDVGEIDKRIQDLRAALTWLEMNVNMLKATIQGLEVQRNTLSALTAIGGSMGEMGHNAAEFFKHATAAAQAAPGTATPVAPAYHGSIPPDWPNSPAQPAQADSDDSGWGAPAAGQSEPADMSSARPQAVEAPDATDAKQNNTPLTDSATATATAMAAPWLSFMQDQFKRIADAAAQPPTPPAASAARAVAQGSGKADKKSANTKSAGIKSAGIKSTRSTSTARSSRATTKPASVAAGAANRKKPNGAGR